MDMERTDEPLSGSEKRRELRKSLEKDTGSRDKFGMNDLMLIGIVLIAMVVSLTDFKLSFGDFKNFTALTLFLYVITTIVYRNRYNKGKSRGRSDSEYIDALKTYRKNKNEIVERGLLSEVPTFCQEYRVRELMEYRKGVLMDVDLDYDEWLEKYRRLTNKEVMRLKLPLNMKNAIITCNNAMPIKLTPGIILNENGESERQSLVGQSGREREIKDKRKDFIQRGLMVLLGGMVAVNMILDFSIITVIQWFVRMLPIISAVIMGDDSGFCDIAVTETSFKKDQTAIINLFFEYKKSKETPTDTPTLDQPCTNLTPTNE